MTWFHGFNFVDECRALNWGLWQCPPFLYLIMGFITIVAMVTTYLFASRYFIDEPEIAALIVIVVTILLFVIGNTLISGFNRIAEANRMKTEFVSLVSHQLRSPLSIFKWTINLMEMRKEQDHFNSEIKTSLYTLHDANERMIRLVNMLLEVSRLEAKTFELRPEELSLPDLTKSVVQNFERFASASNINLNLRLPSDLPRIKADRDRIAMVIENLVDNAVKYTRGGGEILVAADDTGKFLRLIVADHGVGIPEAQKRYIFQKFFRAENAKNSQAKGTGIGLYIAKEIVEASGGKIGFTSQEGKGSTFWFTLPKAA